MEKWHLKLKVLFRTTQQSTIGNSAELLFKHHLRTAFHLLKPNMCYQVLRRAKWRINILHLELMIMLNWIFELTKNWMEDNWMWVCVFLSISGCKHHKIYWPDSEASDNYLGALCSYCWSFCGSRKMEVPKLPDVVVPTDYYLCDTNVTPSTLKALLFLKFSIQVIDYIISLMTM